eukprot:459815-Pelagomonas_calceolata.AAC.4
MGVRSCVVGTHLAKLAQHYFAWRNTNAIAQAFGNGCQARFSSLVVALPQARHDQNSVLHYKPQTAQDPAAPWAATTESVCPAKNSSHYVILQLQAPGVSTAHSSYLHITLTLWMTAGPRGEKASTMACFHPSPHSQERHCGCLGSDACATEAPCYSMPHGNRAIHGWPVTGSFNSMRQERVECGTHTHTGRDLRLVANG